MANAEEAHAITPTVWGDDGSLNVNGNETLTLLNGVGLKLGPGQDAAKVSQLGLDSSPAGLWRHRHPSGVGWVQASHSRC